MTGKARRGAAALGVLAAVCCGCSSTPRPPAFDPMRPDPNYLTAVLGPVTGKGPGTLAVPASRSMSLTMACIGKGTLIVVGSLSGAVLCGDASLSRGAFGGYYWSHVPVRPGERITLRVVADAKTIWDIRVDGMPRHCQDGVCADCPEDAGECG